MSSENRTSVPNSLNEHWMPFTSNKDFKENPRLITEAKGVYLKTHHGKTQIDASSGLFCNPLASVINLGFALKSLLDVNGIQCSFNEFGTEVLFSELIESFF